jgi:PadR family transcriptional regulator PadR
LIHHNMMYICSMYSRELLKGTLDAIILKLLAENDKMYGYEICQKVKELSDGKILIKDGSLYPTLHKLLSEGVLSTESVEIGKRIRKYYRLTPKGKTAKEAAMKELQDFLGTMQSIVFDQPKPLGA